MKKFRLDQQNCQNFSYLLYKSMALMLVQMLINAELLGLIQRYLLTARTRDSASAVAIKDMCRGTASSSLHIALYKSLEQNLAQV